MVDVEVTFEYAAEQEDELNIKVGDIIKNVTMSEGGWWEGELNGKTGMFPDNFVKVIEKAKPTKIKEELPHNKHRGASVRELASKIKSDLHVGMTAPKKKELQPNVKRKRAKVVYSYDPEKDDELKLEVGDIVDILKQEEEGWWEGNVNGRTGVFPSNFVEEIEESEPEKTPEEKPAEPTIEGKKKLIGGVGLGNIFGSGPIKLKPTSVKTSEKVSHSPPDLPVKHTEEESKPHIVTKREKPGLHVRPPIPTPRPSQACRLTPQPCESHTLDSDLEDSGSQNLARSSEESFCTDWEGRDGVMAQDSWVNVLFGEPGSEGETTDRDTDVQYKHLLDRDGVSGEETNVINPEDMISGKMTSNQSSSYAIQSGLNKLSIMQLVQPKDFTEENLIEYADVDVDEENKENVMLGKKCASAIASLESKGSRSSVLGSARGRSNASNNNSVENPTHDDSMSQSKSVDSFNMYTGKQNSGISSRLESWLSGEHQSPTVSNTSVTAAVTGKRKESLFKRVMKLDVFRKRSKSVMPYNEKKTEASQTQNCYRQVPSLTELCRNKLDPGSTETTRTPLKEITAAHMNEKQDPNQSTSFEVSVDSLDVAVGSLETACEKTSSMPEIYDEGDESLLTIIMSQNDINNDDVCDRKEDGAGAQGFEKQNFKKCSTKEDNVGKSNELPDRIVKDSYLGSLNRTGQLSPFIRMIANRYHLFDPESQKWKEGYMDEPEIMEPSDSISPESRTPNSLTQERTSDKQESGCPNAEMGFVSDTTHVKDDDHLSTSPASQSYNVLPPGSVKEKVFHYEHMYVNELVDQVIAKTMHGLCLEQCLEELGGMGHHPELRRRLMEEFKHYTADSIPDAQRSDGEISPQGSEFLREGSDGEIITPMVSDGDTESEDGCVQSSRMCGIEDSLYSAITDIVADTDYATAMSDMDTDGSYVVSFLSNADIDVRIPEPEVEGQSSTGFNASGEYVDLPGQLSHYSCSNGLSHATVKSCDNPILLQQRNMDGPWISPVHTRLRMGTSTCPKKGMFPVPDDAQICGQYTPRCSIGTQTPDMVSVATSADNTPTNMSTFGFGSGGNTEDRASSPIKELLSYDTTLEDSLNTSDLGTPAKVKVKPRYSSSPIKSYRVEDNQSGKFEDTSYKHDKGHCSNSRLTRNNGLLQQGKSSHSLSSRPSSLDVNTDETFDVRDCTETRRKRFSWKKLFRSKAKEPVVLISYRRRSDKEMEEDLTRGSPIPRDIGRAGESERTKPLNSSNHALCESPGIQDHPLIMYRIQPFSEDLNTVETFFSHEEGVSQRLGQCRNQEQNRHDVLNLESGNLKQDTMHLSQDAGEESEEESDGEQYSLCDMEIDEKEEQERIDRIRDTTGHCGQCDFCDLHIHGQKMPSHSTVDSRDPTQEAGRTSQDGVDEKSVFYEDSESEGVSLDSPNISPSLAIAIRNNMVTTPDSPEVNLDSFLQEALRPIDDLLDESVEGVDLEEEEVTPRLDSCKLNSCISESPEKYPGFTYISPSMENILAMDEDDSQYGQGDVPSARYDCQTDTSNLSLEYVLSLERKFQKEMFSPEVINTSQNTPVNTPQHTPRGDQMERYSSFTYIGESLGGDAEDLPRDFCEKEEGTSNLSSSAEGLYDYDDSFESSESEEEQKGEAMEKIIDSDEEKEDIEEIIEVDYSFDQYTSDSSELESQNLEDGGTRNFFSGYRSERTPSFITEYIHSTPCHGQDMFGACAQPTLEKKGSQLQRGDNPDIIGGRSSYSLARLSTGGGLSDSGLLLSFSSSPDETSDTINV